MIKADIIQQISSRIDIVDVISDFVKLKKSGSNFSGLCPFHNEKSPSFSVSKTKEIFKCFGCGKSGNAISFVMEHEKFTYLEAMKWFAKRYHVELEEEGYDPNFIIAKENAESLGILNLYVQKFYSEQLAVNFGNNLGLSYLHERGFSDSVLQSFQVGFAPENINLSTHLLQQQFQKEYIIKSGIGVERNGNIYDNYKNRIIFPIHSLSGKVLGFGARILQQNANKTLPKYINTPETELYSKSKILYGIFFARKTIGDLDECILVEGYTDVLTLHQAGFTNAVASGGTSLTTEQILLIKKFTNNILIIYDGDSAGVAAASRGLRLCLAQSMSVHLLLIPNGNDPDSYIKEYGAQNFKQLLQEQKKDFILFELNIKLNGIENDINKKNELVNEMAETIAQIDKLSDFAKQEYYIQQCAKLLKINENSFTQLINTFIKTKNSKAEKRNFAEETAILLKPNNSEIKANQNAFTEDLLSPEEIAEQHFVRVLLEYGLFNMNSEPEQSVAKYLLEIANYGEEITQADFQFLVKNFAALYANEQQPNAKTFIYSVEERERLVATKCLHYSQRTHLPEWDTKDPFDKTKTDNTIIDSHLKGYKTEQEKQKEVFYLKDVFSVENYFRFRKLKKIQTNLLELISQTFSSAEDEKLHIEALQETNWQLSELAKTMGLQA